MKLVNMKMDPQQTEKEYETSVAVDRPIYPWGLSVTLDNDVLEKLGMRDMPEVGKTLMLHARVDVTGCSKNEHTEGGKTHMHRQVSLQITDLALEQDEGDGGTAADKLYAKGKE